MTVVDMSHIKEIKNDEMHSKCGWTPYNGLSLRGCPVITIVNGNVVFHEGKIYNQFKGREIEYLK